MEDINSSRFAEDNDKALCKWCPFAEGFCFFFGVGHKCTVDMDTNDVGQKVNLKRRTGTFFSGQKLLSGRSWLPADSEA